MKLPSLEPESSASANSAISAFILPIFTRRKLPRVRLNTLITDKFGGHPKEPAMVRETGLEPVRDYHTPLKRARLPIPPLSQVCSEPFLCSLRTLIIIAKAVCYVKPFFKVF